LISETEFLEAYRGTVQPLFAFVMRRAGGERELAEDTVQETFIRALDHWQRHGLPRVPLAWLQTVARNLLVSYYRRFRPVALGDDLPDPEDRRWDPEREEQAALLHQGLSKLGRKESRLLEDFHFDGKTVSEIAAEHDLSERAVEGRLRRARQKLRKKLRRLMPRGRDRR